MIAEQDYVDYLDTIPGALGFNAQGDQIAPSNLDASPGRSPQPATNYRRFAGGAGVNFSPLNLVGDKSVYFRFRHNDISVSDQYIIDTDNDGEFRFRLRNSGYLTVYAGGAGNSLPIPDFSILTSVTDFHITFNAVSGDIKLYIDGTLASTINDITVATGAATSNPFAVGSLHAGNNFDCSEIVVANVVWSQAEIDAARALQTDYPSKIKHILFSETTGSQSYDMVTGETVSNSKAIISDYADGANHLNSDGYAVSSDLPNLRIPRINGAYLYTQNLTEQYSGPVQYALTTSAGLLSLPESYQALIESDTDGGWRTRGAYDLASNTFAATVAAIDPYVSDARTDGVFSGAGYITVLPPSATETQRSALQQWHGIGFAQITFLVVDGAQQPITDFNLTLRDGSIPIQEWINHSGSANYGYQYASQTYVIQCNKPGFDIFKQAIELPASSSVFTIVMNPDGSYS